MLVIIENMFKPQKRLLAETPIFLDYNTYPFEQYVADPIKLDPSRSNNDTVFEFTYELFPDEASSISDIFLEMKYPKITAAAAGDFFSYADLFPIKTIKLIEIEVVTLTPKQKITQHITPNIWLQYLVERYDNFDTIREMFGGSNKIEYAASSTDVLAKEQTYMIPIPYKISTIQPTIPMQLRVKVETVGAQFYSTRNVTFKPKPIEDISCILSKIDGRQNKRIKMDFPRLVKNLIEKTDTRKMDNKNADLVVPGFKNLTSVSLFIFNPVIAGLGENVFYGNTTKSAVCNFINTFFYPASNGLVMLQLKTQLWSGAPPPSITLEQIDAQSFRLVTTRHNIIFAVNMPLESLPEDVYFDAVALLSENNNLGMLDVSNFSEFNLSFLGKLDILLQEPITGRGNIINGLFMADSETAFVGCVNYTLSKKHNLELIKLWAARPAEATGNLFASKNFCIIRDPIYCFADLDQTIRYNLFDVEIETSSGASFEAIEPHVLKFVEFQEQIDRPAFNKERKKQRPTFKFRTLGSKNVVLNSVDTFKFRFKIGLCGTLNNIELPAETIKVYATNLFPQLDSRYLLRIATIFEQIEIYTTGLMLIDPYSNEYKNKIEEAYDCLKNVF